MEYQVLAIYDSAVDGFMRPLFAPSVGAGVRSFTDEVNRVDSEVNKHPSDYVFYRLGTWEDVHGNFQPLEDAEMVCRAVDVLVKCEEVRRVS